MSNDKEEMLEEISEIRERIRIISMMLYPRSTVENRIGTISLMLGDLLKRCERLQVRIEDIK